MTAQTLIEKVRIADPSATVFVFVQGRYVRIDDVVLSGLEPGVKPLTSVCLRGEEFVPASLLPSVLVEAADAE